ncbi:hypothetical protein QQX98_001261 [Neonectria punicea]|uniref:Uncharacterized protein n=1 Tax=Neonectria punicea TaxID=979145 RepID=A0ABR1HQZ8_9HYPO
MPLYREEDLDDLEISAENANPDEQSVALGRVVRIFEENAITYGVMGGMNFYLRGSGRTTGDVDIAVDNRPRMDALLDVFNNQEGVYRPANRMQWVSGVARIFVDVKGQLVQIDLKPKGAEGHLIPSDITGSLETLTVNTSSGTFSCQILAIGPLAAAKIKSHYSRETRDDYTDLVFICTNEAYRAQVRAAARTFRQEWKDCFMDKVIEHDSDLEESIRWALDMPRTPSPETDQPLGTSAGGSNQGGGRGGDGLY